MSRLDRLVAAEREVMVPTASARAANLAAVQRALGDGRVPLVEAPPIGAPLVTSGRSWLKPAVIGAVVLAIGAFAVLYASRPLDEPPAADPVVDVEAPVVVARETPTTEARAPTERAPVASPPSVAAPPSAAAPITPDPPTAIVERPAAPTRAPKRSIPQAERDDFAAELRLLKRAKTSHTTGDREAALATLREQARDFPRGAFVEERRALEAIVLCELGRERGDAAASAFYRDFAASPQTERVRRACD